MLCFLRYRQLSKTLFQMSICISLTKTLTGDKNRAKRKLPSTLSSLSVCLSRNLKAEISHSIPTTQLSDASDALPSPASNL